MLDMSFYAMKGLVIMSYMNVKFLNGFAQCFFFFYFFIIIKKKIPIQGLFTLGAASVRSNTRAKSFEHIFHFCIIPLSSSMPQLS